MFTLSCSSLERKRQNEMLVGHFIATRLINSTRNIFKKIYDEVTEDIFDMSNVRTFNKEIEKKKKEIFILC